MNVVASVLYDSAINFAQFGARLARANGSKLSRTFYARRALMERWRALAAQRDPGRPLVWFHAPSVGEGLQARPIIELLRQAQPDVQIAYTFFSPSAATFAGGLNVHMAEYLPFDSATTMRQLMHLLRPDALFFVKLDVWPNMVKAAHDARVFTGLLSATVAPRSRRQGVLSQLFLRDAYRALDVVGVIDGDDALRLEQMGVRREALRLTGDTRLDQVWARAAAVDRAGDVLVALNSERPTVVAGSTWPSDEAVLFGAWAEVVRRVPRARLVVAPHEPTPGHVDALIMAARRLNLACSLLSDRLGSEAKREGAGFRYLGSEAKQEVRLGSEAKRESAGFRYLGSEAKRESAGFRYLGSEAKQEVRLGSESGGEKTQGSGDRSDADVIIIDSVGVLGDVYAIASVAYIGGGFQKAGLHSVLEPAAYGVPVVFGPGFDMSRDASMLIADRGARSIGNTTGLADVLSDWLINEDARADWGARALTTVRGGLGAAQRSLDIVLGALRNS